MWEVSVYSRDKKVGCFRWFNRRSKKEAIILSLEESVNMGYIKEDECFYFKVCVIKE